MTLNGIDVKLLKEVKEVKRARLTEYACLTDRKRRVS